MSKYGPKAQATIDQTMHEFSEGKLKSGPTGARVTNRQQALAIGISKARSKHMKTPAQREDQK